MPTDFREDPKPMVEAIRYVGAEHCIMSTDLGQYYNPPPAEGMRMFIALLLKNGISEREIELMAKKNPAKLLDID
jgi:predicted TIM-barrel fold metal-dependent hydrolase